MVCRPVLPGPRDTAEAVDGALCTVSRNRARGGVRRAQGGVRHAQCGVRRLVSQDTASPASPVSPVSPVAPAPRDVGEGAGASAVQARREGPG